MIAIVRAMFELSLEYFLASDARKIRCESYSYQDGKCIGKQYQLDIMNIHRFTSKLTLSFQVILGHT